MKLTKANIPKLLCPNGKSEAAFSDDEISGLVLRVYDTGKKAWYLRFRDASGRSRRLLIGDAKAIDPAAARNLARKAITEVAGGSNPVEAKKAARKAMTCDDLFAIFLDHAKASQRPKSYDSTQRALNKYALPLHKEPVEKVDRALVRQFRDKLAAESGNVTANRTLAALSSCWSWAIRNGVIAGESNPAGHVDKYKETPRERVLTMSELRAIWQSTEPGRPYHRIVRLLMLTGARRGEVGGIEWSELTDALWTVPSSRAKGGVAHEVPLPAEAIKQLPKRPEQQSERDKHSYVFGIDTPFSGWSKGKTRLDKALGFSNWTLHDFRRTFSTEMNSRGLAAPHIIEAVLGHIGAKGGVSGVYNLASFRSQKAEALEQWVKLLLQEDVFR